ncbi:MAG: hypothetical protein IT239_02315 [Bacteroidia bacterium]|nr:hypothetical protein [Bacteroidia bacterium]
MLNVIVFILLQVNLLPITDTLSVTQHKKNNTRLDTVVVVPDSQVVTIDDILIIGNKKTKDPIIFRELLLQANELVNGRDFKLLLEKSRSNLFNTGLFNQVDVDYIPIAPNRVKLVVVLVEQSYFWPFPIIELADRNINTWWLTKDFSRINFGLYLFKFNFRGKKETVAFKAKYGFTRQVGLTYTKPYIDKKQRWGFSAGVSYSINKQLIYTTLNNKILFFNDFKNVNRKEFSANINYTYRHGIYSYHAFNIKYTNVGVSDTILKLQPHYLTFKNAPKLSLMTLEYNYRLDRRNYRSYPTAGYCLELYATQNGIGFLKNEPVTMRYITLAAKKYFPITNRWNAGIMAKGKISDKNYQSYYLQRALGYTVDFVRGYEYYVIDGQHFALGKSNIKYQLIQLRKFPANIFNTLKYNIYLTAFSDAGYVRDLQYFRTNFLNNKWLYSYGVGLDFAVSNDFVLRFEIAKNHLTQTGFYLHFDAPL